VIANKRFQLTHAGARVKSGARSQLKRNYVRRNTARELLLFGGDSGMAHAKSKREQHPRNADLGASWDWTGGWTGFVSLALITLVATFLGVFAAQVATHAYDASRDRQTVRALLWESRDDLATRAKHLEVALLLLPKDPRKAGTQIDQNPVSEPQTLDYVLHNDLFATVSSPQAAGFLLNESQNVSYMVSRASRRDIPGDQRAAALKLLQKTLAEDALAVDLEVQFLDGKLSAAQADAQMRTLLVDERLRLDQRGVEVTTIPSNVGW
jgi:hypothetical protein